MIRRILFQAHWLLGITAGLVLALMGVTGAMMSFENEIMTALSPGVARVTPSPLRPLSSDALVAAVSRQRDGIVVTQLVIEADPARAPRVTFLQPDGKSRQRSFVDPVTGDLLGSATGETFFGKVRKLHRWLLLSGDGNGPGRQITAACAIALIFFALSGLYLRWPSRPLNWRSWLLLDLRKSGRSLYYGLHSVVGAWLILFYLTSAMTGLWWSYGWYQNGVRYALTGSVQKAKKDGDARSVYSSARLDPAWATFLNSDMRRFERVTINAPGAGQPVEMQVLPAGARFDRMTDTAQFQTGSGELVNVKRYRDRSVGAAVATNIFPIHSGAFFGMFGRIALFVSSLTLPLFAITGLLMYFARARPKRELVDELVMQPPAQDGTGQGTLVLYASQTGNAEQIARRTVAAMPGAMLRSLAELDPAELRDATRALFVVSTYGEGQAPDGARGFEKRGMSRLLDLASLDFAVLALGDREHSDFCAFGRRIDAWLKASGGHRLFDLIEVDRLDLCAERMWQRQLGLRQMDSAAGRLQQAPFWTLAEREHVNPGSLGDPMFRIVLTSKHAETWLPGAIAEILPRHDPARVDRWLAATGRSGSDARLRESLLDKQLPADDVVGEPDAYLSHRSYSIASVETSGAVELLVRTCPAPDGGWGIGSGWLTRVAAIGDQIQLRVRPNPGFGPPASDVPMILIGNGTGIAGLMGHIRARVTDGGAPIWLLHGERSRAFDRPFGDQIDALVGCGAVVRVDRAWSRDADCGRYVQDLVADHADDIVAWVDRGAAIYVCGSLMGMASAVDDTLRGALGEDRLDQMRDEQRYRRDVY
jgi:sulfite reductase (NADPH) flavoprotein alpha-component